MSDVQPLWPLSGLWAFLARPGRWWRPLLMTALLWALIMLSALGALWLSWPATVPESWWDTLLAYSLPFAWAALCLLAGWLLVFPLAMGLAYETLARACLRDQGVAISELALMRGLMAGLSFLLRTLHWRLGWLLLGVLALIVPGLNLVALPIAALGLGHVALLDACDLCLGLQGLSGRERSELLAEHREELLIAGLLAGFAGQLLGLTLIGWWFWMPGLVCGAAQATPRWIRATETRLMDRCPA